MRALAMYSSNTAVRFNPNFVLYADSIMFLGTQKHEKYIDNCYTMKDFGAFAMTELGHGSNIHKLETTATFD